MTEKRKISLLIYVIVIAAIAGCGSNGAPGERTSNKQSGVENVLQSGMSEADKNAGEAAKDSQNRENDSGRTETGNDGGKTAKDNEEADQNSETTGTNNAETEQESEQAGADESANDSQNGISTGAPEPEVESEDQTVLSTTEGIDIDLTSLSGTMVYSEVYNMLYIPEDYIGKTIKMDGLFTAYHDETTGNDYFSCIIQDATACCAQGMEFVLTDDYSYPDDYPQEGELITVTGVFDTYMEDDYIYCTLRNAVLAD